VVCPEAASAMVSRCWEEQRERDCGLDSGRNDGSLYASSKDFLELVKQVGSSDKVLIPSNLSTVTSISGGQGGDVGM